MLQGFPLVTKVVTTPATRLLTTSRAGAVWSAHGRASIFSIRAAPAAHGAMTAGLMAGVARRGACPATESRDVLDAC
jgi:hypothetical protein